MGCPLQQYGEKGTAYIILEAQKSITGLNDKKKRFYNKMPHGYN